jgi:hypothetical protein
MEEMGRLSVLIRREGREKTEKRWADQWRQIANKLAGEYVAFLEALRWAFHQPPGHTARFWWDGNRGRCDSPGAWLKQLSGEERTRAESLIEKHRGSKAAAADKAQEARTRTARRFEGQTTTAPAAWLDDLITEESDG